LFRQTDSRHDLWLSPPKLDLPVTDIEHRRVLAVLRFIGVSSPGAG
jgi:hypothetical protein